MSYNSKNYSKDGGDTMVIDGTLDVSGTIDLSDSTIIGNIETQANTTATTVAGLVTDFNALLAKLKASGLMASE